MLGQRQQQQTWMWLVRELGAESGERGARKMRAGSKDCCKKSKNRLFSPKIDFFHDVICLEI